MFGSRAEVCSLSILVRSTWGRFTQEIMLFPKLAGVGSHRFVVIESLHREMLQTSISSFAISRFNKYRIIPFYLGKCSDCSWRSFRLYWAHWTWAQSTIFSWLLSHILPSQGPHIITGEHYVRLSKSILERSIDWGLTIHNQVSKYALQLHLT